MRFSRGRHEVAAADFREAIALDDTRHFAHLGLAQALGQLGRLDEAIGRLGLAIGRQPERPELYRERALAGLRRETLSPAQADSVLADLAEAARREGPSGRAAAMDHARRGRLLLRLDRPGDALAAAEMALGLAPGLAEAHLVRIGALLELRRYAEVVNSCDAALAGGPPTADLLRLRGLGRAGRGDFPGAIEDYSQALALRPAWPQALGDRGWSYLFAAAPTLALRDFEASLRLAPADPGGLAGRAASRLDLGQVRESLADAEASLKRDAPAPRTLYNAARVYAQAATRAGLEIPRRGRAASREEKAYRDRARALLGQAVERTPAEDRDRWLREVVGPDPILRGLREGRPVAGGLNPAMSSSTTPPAPEVGPR